MLSAEKDQANVLALDSSSRLVDTKGDLSETSESSVEPPRSALSESAITEAFLPRCISEFSGLIVMYRLVRFWSESTSLGSVESLHHLNCYIKINERACQWAFPR